MSDPLRIDEITLPGGAGVIGMTLCPGQKGGGIFSGVLERDLEKDLEAITAWGGAALVTLLEEHELRMLDVPHLPARVLSKGLHWIHLPIRDGHTPDETFVDLWGEVSPLLHRFLNRGEKILLHCRWGVGRTGMVAALLLVEQGVEPDVAIGLVRSAREGSIETPMQEQYVHGWRNLLMG